jgi:hypothetical protein
MTDIELAYEVMVKNGYKPVVESVESASEYAKHFSSEEAHGFYIGSPDARTSVALAYTVEAARCMCRISDLQHAAGLLQMAIDALEKPIGYGTRRTEENRG